MDEILIRVKAVHDDPYGCDSVSLSHEQVDFEQLLLEQSDYLFQMKGLVQIDPKRGIDKKAAELLRKHGWVHTETAKTREEKKSLEHRFYLIDEKGKGVFYEPPFSEVDIENLTDEQLRQLARGGKLVQVVSAKSVLPAASYKKLQTKKKQLEEAAKRAKDAAKKRAEKKKQKELERAKKLLEEADVQV